MENDAKFERNLSVEKHLNIVVENVGEPYIWETRDVYRTKISTCVMAGDGAYDIVTGDYTLLTELVPEGVFTNLIDYEYLDFTILYWTQQLIEATSIAGKLYLDFGDISAQTLPACRA